MRIKGCIKREDRIMILKIQIWKITYCDATNGKITTKRRARLEEKAAFVFNVLSLKFK